MKKITLLFATMLAMFGTGFGQKEGKVLWENLVDSKPLKLSSGNDLTMYSQTPFISASGNSLINYGYNYGTPFNSSTEGGDFRTYDKNGKILWRTSDYYKKSKCYYDYESNKYKPNKNYYTLDCIAGGIGTAYDDSLFLFDKDFKFQKSFDINSNGAFIVKAEDGIFYTNPQKTLIKYDINGKEEWRFENKDAIKIITQRPPHLGLVSIESDKKHILIFDKNGNKKGETSPQTFNAVYQTSDKGFWLNTSPDLTKAELIRYDSTGKELVKVSVVSLISTFSDVNFAYELLSDNSLALAYLDSNYEINIVKIDEKGKKTKIQKDLGIKADFEVNPLDNNSNPRINGLKIAKNGAIKYSISYASQTKTNPRYGIKYAVIFGAEKFDDLKFGWFRAESSVINSLLINILSEDDVTQVTYNYYSGRADMFTYGGISYYDIDGKLKWTYNDASIKKFLRKGNQLYIYQTFPQNINQTSLYALDYNTGKTLWKVDNITVYYLPPYETDLKVDKLDNTYLQYYDSVNKLKFQVIKKDGTVLWQYNSPNYFNTFELDNDGIIATTFEYPNSQLQYFIRKISPCTALNAISLTGNTEACPTEKIKLSIQKQEGVTYQWQKDGKDLPSFKDAVYDIGESGTYTVNIKDEICQNQATSNALKISIRSLPNVEIKTAKITFCEGDKTTITATTNGVFFQWQKDQKDIPNATSGIFEATQAGDYRVGVRDDKCPQVGYSNTYTINVKPLPEANISTDIKTVIYEPFTVKMTASSGTNLSYQWLKDEVIIDNATTNIYEAKKSGKYKVSITKDGCLKTSEALTISIQIPLANESEIGEETVQIYPNPSQGKFKIVLPKTLQNAEIQLFDILGRERSVVHTGEQAQADGLVQGVYFLRVNKGEKSILNKIVIE